MSKYNLSHYVKRSVDTNIGRLTLGSNDYNEENSRLDNTAYGDYAAMVLRNIMHAIEEAHFNNMFYKVHRDDLQGHFTFDEENMCFNTGYFFDESGIFNAPYVDGVDCITDYDMILSIYHFCNKENNIPFEGNERLLSYFMMRFPRMTSGHICLRRLFEGLAQCFNMHFVGCDI